MLEPKNWKRLLAYIINNGVLKPDKEKHFRFLKEHNVVSAETYYKNIEKINDKYDIFITGSDQVWNYSSSGFDKNYFFQFSKNKYKKRSYAASFGFKELPEKYKEEYYSLLKDFNNFSVREESGQRIIKQLLGENAKIDLDPTLLISGSQWSELCDTNRKDIMGLREKKYVLVYMISENMEILNLSKKLAKKNDAKVIYINDRWKNRKGVINVKKISIEEWLFLFKNASYIITNSFHGVAFSINMNKQFLVVENKDLKKSSTRIESLLKETQLENRYIDNIEKANKVFDVEIDYLRVNRLMEELRKKSIENLKLIIQ